MRRWGRHRYRWAVLLAAAFTTIGATPVVLAGIAEGQTGWTAQTAATARGSAAKVFPGTATISATNAAVVATAAPSVNPNPTASPSATAEPSPSDTASPSPGTSEPAPMPSTTP